MYTDIIVSMLQAIGENPRREGLVDTPRRVIKSWSTLFGGYSQDPKEILGTVFDSDNYDQMIVLRDIEMFSTCEHHMLPFFGKVHVAYIPNGKVVGLSKLARLVECYARRLQIQERLTQQIADAIIEHTGALGCGVVIEAKHFCMVARGVSKQNSVMSTCAIRGAFTEEKVKEEFLKLMRGPKV
jgi:GTP cyclohydrolase I